MKFVLLWTERVEVDHFPASVSLIRPRDNMSEHSVANLTQTFVLLSLEDLSRRPSQVIKPTRGLSHPLLKRLRA